jgi:hypothetical protein
MINVGENGQFSDGELFSHPLFYEKFQRKLFCLSQSDNLPKCTVKMQYAVVGDNAFQLMKNSLSPFNHRKLIFEAVVCSYKLP